MSRRPPAGGLQAAHRARPRVRSTWLALLLCACMGGAQAQRADAPPWPDSFTLARVQFDGGPHPALGDAELQALAAPFLNRPLRALDVEELRQRITRRCVERGYISSGALVADDALQGDTLRVQLLVGRVGTVRQRGLDGLAPAYVEQRLLRSGDVLDVHRLQDRFQWLLADPLFRRINVSVVPGAVLGQATLDIDAERAAAWSATVFAHNQGAPAVGSAVAGVEFGLRNLSSWGDTLAATLSRSGGSDSGELSWAVPLAAHRTTLTLHASHGRASVTEEPLDALGVDSVVRGRDITLAHPVVDGARQRLVLGATWGRRDNRTTLGGEPFSLVPGEPTGQPAVRAWRWFQELTLRGERHALTLRSTFASGRSNVPADAGVPGAPAARYRLWQGQLLGSAALGDGGARLQLRAVVQHTGDTLVPLEQLSVGGRHTVRGYRENTLVRDRGWAFGLEGWWPLLGADGARRSVALVPFADLGRAANVGGPAARLAAVGLGLQARIDDIEAEIHFARRLERRPVDTRGDLQDHGIHLSLRWRAL